VGFSCRVFLVDRNDELYRLANTKFGEMLRSPASHCLPFFAGQRVRAAGAIVKLVCRVPDRIIRITFDILTFDDEGHLDPTTFGRQQFARAELAMAPSIAVADDNATVVDATTRFIAQGGRWAPSKDLARAINDAALGRTKCPRL
jgi:hypothetical protein